MNILKLSRMLLILCFWLAAPAMAGISGGGFLKGFDGSVHTLDEYTGQGKWTIVMIWVSDCHVCNQEASAYDAFHKAHKNKDATVLGLTLDGDAKKADAEEFIKRHNVTFPNLIAEPDTVMQLYTQLTGQSWVGTPSFLIFSPSGELRAAQVGAVAVELIEAFIAKEGIK